MKSETDKWIPPFVPNHKLRNRNHRKCTSQIQLSPFYAKKSQVTLAYKQNNNSIR